MADTKATVFRPYTECIMEYTSLPQLVYDLENNKAAFKNWFVQMNGRTMSVPDFIQWFYETKFNFMKGKYL